MSSSGHVEPTFSGHTQISRAATMTALNTMYSLLSFHLKKNTVSLLSVDGSIFSRSSVHPVTVLPNSLQHNECHVPVQKLGD